MEGFSGRIIEFFREGTDRNRAASLMVQSPKVVVPELWSLGPELCNIDIHNMYMYMIVHTTQ